MKVCAPVSLLVLSVLVGMHAKAANAASSVVSTEAAALTTDTISCTGSVKFGTGVVNGTPATGSETCPGSATTAATPTPSETTPAVPAIVRSTVEVNADEQQNTREEHKPFHASSQEIQSSAGTYGDFSRYLQLLPGVAFNSDESDDVLVRGGNPIENLYLLDGIEIPNINHIATETTTGGLVSMIDTAAIDSIDFQSGGYDARYYERLSSVIAIHTRELQTRQPYTEADAGFIGAGLIRETPFRNNGALLLSVHRSLLNLFTNNIGLNGVPIYTNMLTHAQWEPNRADFVSIDSLGGIDSIDITPQSLDDAETNTINTQYKGWRITNGLSWRHIYSTRSFGIITISDSEQEQDIRQQDQLFDDTVPAGYTQKNLPIVPVYSELTHDGMTNGRYDGYQSSGPKETVLFGASAHLNRIAYNVSQPLGEQSPLNSNPERSDATTFAPNFWTGDSGYYTQLTSVLGHWTLSAGGRAQIYGFNGNLTVTPRVSAAYSLSTHIGLHASVGEYDQMPPFLYLTSFPQNHLLKPIGVRQIIAGVDSSGWRHGAIAVEIYQKNYRDYPVSTEYPSLSLANIIDTLGQEFIWIPMTSRGNGLTRGIEVSGRTQFGSTLFIQANVSYSRSLFSGLDGVMRPGNFDYPIVMNASGRYLPSPHYEVSFRYEYTSGRPYTPFLLEETAAQDRPIYDLSRINAVRGPFYSRLDFRGSRTFFVGQRRFSAYGGLENALDRQNFLGNAWLTRYGLGGHCERSPNHCVSQQNQMGLFPNFGANVIF